MASLNGVQLRSLKFFEGMEGYGFNATVYLNGKRVGTAMDQGDGGALYLNIQQEWAEKLNDISKLYFDKYPSWLAEGSATTQNYTEPFINELVEFSELEKSFKKEAKKGNGLVVCQFVERTASPFTSDGTYIEDKIYSVPLQKINESFLTKLQSTTNPISIKTYQTLDDFIIET